jgi:carbon storage regulator
MLILSRKSNESIVIGGTIRVTVASIRGRYVRLGVEAPGEIGIYREELCSDPIESPGPAASKIGPRIQAEEAHRSVARVEGSGNDRAVTLDA